MTKTRYFSILLTGILIFNFSGNLLAEEEKKEEAKEPVKESVSAMTATGGGPAVKEEKVEKVEKVEANIKAKVDEKKCTCDTPAVQALSKAYNSLEEDEWIDAIKICKETINAIGKLAETCKCTSGMKAEGTPPKERTLVEVYSDIASAYLKYAQGGQILDGEDDIDCPKAKSLYDDAMKTLKVSIDGVQNEELKLEVENIKDYCEEEKAFVDDECE